jgi:signal peptidase I
VATPDPGKRGFWQTAKAATFSPREWFAEPAAERTSWGPLKFAFGIAAIALPPAAAVEQLLRGAGVGSAVGASLATLVLSPVITLISVYFTAAITQLWLWIVRGKRGTFSETMACVCYTSAPSLLGVVPFLGGLIGGVWQLVLLVIGLRQVHQTTLARAVFAVVAGPTSLALLALFLRAGVVEALKIPSGAMLPSLQINDHVFVTKLAYGPLIPGTDTRLYTNLPPEYGDVTVFRFPEPTEPPQDFIKRVIALPGDELVVDGGHPVINGWRVPSCRVGAYELTVPGDARTTQGELFVEFLGPASYLVFYENERFDGRQGPYRVPPGEVWVLGDNRNNSSDSRSWFGGKGGGVPFANIKGRANIVWMAFGADGQITWERLFHPIMGKPALPKEAPAELARGVERCLSERPAVTRPPVRRPE